jgi:acyl-coenzyme A synthetase/AMP-(fatty) acid ligase
MLSCLRLGLVAVPANPSPGDPGQLERRAFAAGCRGAVVSADASWTSARMPAAKRFVLDLEALLPVSEPSPAVKVSPSHPAVVFFDTAGQPYSIPVAGLLAQAVSSMERMIPGPSDSGERRGRLWLEVPGHHASFAAASLGALMSGLELVIPRPKAVADTMEQAGRMASSGSCAALVHGALLSPQAPSTADGTLAAGALELVILEGDSVGPSANALLRQRVFGGAVHVVQAVARPEVGGFVLGVDPGAVGALPGCGGLPLPGFDLSIVDHRTRRCEAGMGGFVALNRHVPGLSLELAGQEMPVVLGLRARMDRESRFWPMGEGDVLRPELEQYSVTEIETLVSGLDGVERVAVVHFTDARGVVRSVMYLETEGGADAAEAARAAIVASFGPDAAPETIWPVKRLPVTRSGKLLRSVLRRVAAGDLVGLDQVCSPHLIDGLLVPGGGSGQKQ